MRAENIVLRKDVGVAETQIHMRVRRKVEYGVDVVFLQALDHIARNRHIAVEEAKIRLRLQHARIVQRAAVVELVEGYHVVVVRIFDGQVAYQPGPTFCIFGAGQLSASNWLYQNRDFLDSDTVWSSLAAYMNPSPPVTSMFLTLPSGLNEVWPVKMGASCQVPSSTKKRDSRLVGPDVTMDCQLCERLDREQTSQRVLLTTGAPS